MLHLGNPNLSPPGSFKILDAELGMVNPKLATLGPFHSLYDLENEWSKRRSANGLPPLSHEVMEDRVCALLPPGHCRDEMGQPTLDPGATALSLMDVTTGTIALATWFARGKRRVSADETVRRSYLCAECPWHRSIVGCTTCSGAALRGIINEIIGGVSIPTDSMLGACGVCKCSLVAKTRMHTEDALVGLSKEKKAQLWERCWLKEAA